MIIKNRVPICDSGWKTMQWLNITVPIINFLLVLVRDKLIIAYWQKWKYIKYWTDRIQTCITDEEPNPHRLIVDFEWYSKAHRTTKN